MTGVDGGGKEGRKEGGKEGRKEVTNLILGKERPPTI